MCFLSFLLVRAVCAVRTPHMSPRKSPCFLVVDLAKSIPLEFSLFLPPLSIVDCTLVAISFFFRFLSHSALSILRILRCPMLVIFGLHPRYCFPFLFNPFVLYNHRIRSDRPYTSNPASFSFSFSLVALKKHCRNTNRVEKNSQDLSENRRQL